MRIMIEHSVIMRWSFIDMAALFVLIWMSPLQGRKATSVALFVFGWHLITLMFPENYT